MTKRSIDSNWKKLLKTGEVTHKKKKKPKADYIKKTKDGKKTIWFDVDQSVLDTSKAENVDALDPKAVGDKKIKFLSKNLVSIDCEMVVLDLVVINQFWQEQPLLPVMAMSCLTSSVLLQKKSPIIER